MTDLKIAVVGAGIVGTTTAFELQKQLRNANIDIIADKFRDDTTSYVAAGIFRPGTSFCGPSEDITQKWIDDSYDYWNHLHKTQGTKSGVIELSGYLLSSQFPDLVRNKFIEQKCPVYRQCSPEELQKFPGNWKYGSYFTTFLTQTSYFVPYIMDIFQDKGGKVVERKIDSLEKLGLDYDVVVNCTGLASRFLCGDRHIVPVRGQVIKVKAPWIKTFLYGDYDTYILPGIDSVTLGGCRNYESWDTSVNKYDGLKIRESCENLVPSLKNAEVIGEKVGLRPHRGVVRVEKEVKNYGGRRVKIVHNYGHGGYGVTTAPGTALYACRLVNEVLSGNSKL